MSETALPTAPGTTRHRVVLVSGLSGAGKASILRALEDIGYEAVDNPPLDYIENLVSRNDGRLAVGVDARSRGFEALMVLETLERLRRDATRCPRRAGCRTGWRPNSCSPPRSTPRPTW